MEFFENARDELLFTLRNQEGMTFKFIKSEDGHFVHTLCEGNLRSKLGQTSDMVVGHTLYEIFPEEYAREKEQFYKRAWSGEENVQYEGTWFNPEWGTVTYLASMVPIIREGRVVEVIVSCVDITKRKEAEIELKSLKEQFEAVFQHTAEAIDLVDLKFNVVRVNKTFEKMYGWKNEELVGKPLPIFVEELMEETEKNIRKIQEGKPVIEHETVRKKKDGKLIQVSLTAAPYMDKYGNTVGYSVISRDITGKKKLDDLLRQSEKLSVAGQLAAGIAHEIRNPLTSIRGFLQLLKPDLEHKQHIIEIMLSELDRINFIVGELLGLSKPELIKMSTKELMPIVKSTATFIESHALMNGVQICIQLDKAAEQPLYIDCSEVHIKQVFINLLKNAMESMDGKKGIVTIQVEVNKNKEVILHFIDQGGGIPQELVPKLGEPFFTTKEKGTGLGLMTCFNIIKAHNGTMEVKSTLLIGTTVSLYLPLSNNYEEIKVIE